MRFPYLNMLRSPQYEKSGANNEKLQQNIAYTR